MSPIHHHNRILRNLALLLACSFSLFLLFVVSGRAAEISTSTVNTSQLQEVKNEIVVQVPLPIMQAGNCVLKEHKGKTCVGSYAEYIGLIYGYFSGIVGILAAVILLWGGFKWLTAAGNESRVESAKETIYSAIIALVIVLGSYVILYTINPQLTKPNLYGVQPVGRIDQPFATCSNNAPALIDFVTMKSTCDPTTENCCGQKFPLKNQGDEPVYCQWDTCPKADEVCVSSGSVTANCVPVKTFCEQYGGNDKRSYCSAADVTMQQAKQWDGPEQKFKQKFSTTGCGFTNIAFKNALGLARFTLLITSPGAMLGANLLTGHDAARDIGKDTCTWNTLLTKLPASAFSKPVEQGYDPVPVSCTTPGAKGVCWDSDDKGNTEIKYCGNVLFSQTHIARYKCAEPTDQRAVAGTAGYCLVKKGKQGSTSPADYACWPVQGRDLNAPF